MLWLIEHSPAQVAHAYELTAAQAAGLQRYIVMICVVALRARRGIPHDRELTAAWQLRRCLAPRARALLCDDLLYAISN